MAGGGGGGGVWGVGFDGVEPPTAVRRWTATGATVGLTLATGTGSTAALRLRARACPPAAPSGGSGAACTVRVMALPGASGTEFGA